MQKNQQAKKSLRLNLKDYDILTTVGHGSFGLVKLMRRKGTNRYVCAKVMKKEQLIRSQQVDHIYNQYRILSTIDHPFVVKFEGLAQNSKNILLFMEYIPGGQLFTLLRDEGMFSVEKAAFYASQIVQVFQYLHLQNIIYRDLKPQNILIAKDGYVKLTDFGFAKKTEGRTFTLCGTPQYLAPQILMNQGHGKPVDWWTLGVLLYQMIAGIDPFADEDPLVIYQNILRGKIQFPKEFDSNAKSLVRHLLASDLTKRYGNLKNGVKDIKEHRFFNQTNFQQLMQKKIKVPYIPNIKGPADISHYFPHPQKSGQGSDISPTNDPFLKWVE